MDLDNNELLDDSGLNNPDSGDLSSQTVKQIADLSYWARFYAIISLSTTALIALGIIIAMGRFPLEDAIIFVLSGVLVGLLFAAWLQFKLLQYGNSLREYSHTRNLATLETAFGHRKIFWIVGVIASILGMLLGVFLVYVAIMAAVAR